MFKAQRKISLFLAIAFIGSSCSHPEKVVVVEEARDRVISSEPVVPLAIESNATIRYPWPANYEVAEMDEMTSKIREDLSAIVDMKPKKVGMGSVMWGGVKRLNYILAQRDIPARFSRTALSLQKERGKDALDVILFSFIHVGMDQGIKDFNNGPRVTKIRDNVNALEVLLRDPEKWKEQIQSTLEDLNNGLKGISDSPELSMREMRSIPIQETEVANARALAEMVEGYYSISTKNNKQIRMTLEHFFLSYFEVTKEQGIRLQLRDNRTILSLEQRVIEKTYADLKRNGSLSKNDMEFLKVSLGQLRERLN